MKTIKTKTLLLAIAFFAMIQFSFAQEGSKELAMANPKTETKIENWVLVSSQIVDYTIDRDVIDMEESMTKYTALKFNVKNGKINLYKCTVHFENGDDQDISFATSAGQEQVVDLKGNTRNIDKITFWYDTKDDAEHKAVVEVWGKK